MELAQRDVFAAEGRGVSIMWILCRDTFLLKKDGECDVFAEERRGV